jgi:hypothetical protein
MLTIPLLLHVVLAIPPGAMPSAISAAAIAEAALIWAPYGVVVEAPCAGRPDDALVVNVDVVSKADSVAAMGGPRLGAIQFDTDGRPRPVIFLHLGEIAKFVLGEPVLGLDQAAWPAALRALVLGRVVGRVLAHEVGHYLLRTPQHARTGLMRPRHSASDFVSPDRTRFALARETAALVAALAVTSERPASAGLSNDNAKR